MNSVARGSREYLQWKNDILKKYDSKCVLCNSLDRIDVHHILPYKKYPHFAIHPENGVTLCYDCHRYVHLNGHDFSVFLPDDLLNTFRDYHKSMFVDGVYQGYDIGLLPRKRIKEIGGKVNLFYFTHDCNMRHSFYVKGIESSMGNLIGYSCYVMALEYLVSCPGNSMPLDNLNVANTIGIPIGLYNLLNSTAISVGAFYLDDYGMVRSKYVDEFIDDVERKSNRGKKGGKSKKPDLNVDTGN
jgi:hypothetical protein